MAFQLTKGEWYKEIVSQEQMYAVFDPKYIAEADEFGIQFGSGEFMIYQYLRSCENKSKFRIMAAGLEHIKERFGFDSEKNVRDALNSLVKKGAVVHVHLENNKCPYRTKNKVWVSTKKYTKIAAKATNGASKKLSVAATDAGGTTNAAPVSTPIGEEKEEYINTIPKSTPVAPLLNSQISSSNSTVPASPVAPPASRTETSPEFYFSRASTTKEIEPSLQVSTPVSSTSPVSNLQLQGVPTPVSGISTPVNPFSSAVSTSKVVDLKKDKNRENRKIALLGQRLLREVGAKAKRPGGQLIKLIKSELSKGYSEFDLIIACKRGREHDWYSSQGIFAMLSEKGLAFLTNDEAWKKYKEDKAIGDALWY